MSNNISWQLKELLEPILKGFTAKHFGSRAVFNNEDWEYLFRSKTFKNDLRETRDELDIPKLKPEEDYRVIQVDYDGKNEEVSESDWVHSLTNEQFDKFDKKVKWLLDKNDLPLNFREYIEFYLLYGKKPKGTPKYNLGLFNQILKYSEELKRIPLTIGEKKIIKFYIRDVYGERIKKDKSLKKAYKELMQSLAQSKNKRRRRKSFSTAIKAVNKPKRKRIEYDKPEERYTYRNLATDLTNKDLNENETKKKAARLRKQKQRLNERYDSLSVKPEN